MHLAIRLGVRQLEIGDEAKQLFVLTDGFPAYTRRDGRSFDTRQLMVFVKKEVQKARQHGINVTGVMIGKDLDDMSMSYMFGSRKNWAYVSTEKLGSELVQLVAASFVNYLRLG